VIDGRPPSRVRSGRSCSQKRDLMGRNPQESGPSRVRSNIDGRACLRESASLRCWRGGRTLPIRVRHSCCSEDLDYGAAHDGKGVSRARCPRDHEIDSSRVKPAAKWRVT